MKRQLTKEGRAYVGHVTPILLFYLLLYVLDIDQPSSDNAPWYTLTVLWTSAITCGFISKLLGLPPLVGQLAAGIILANATTGTSNIDLPDNWHSRIRSSVSALEVSPFISGFHARVANRFAHNPISLFSNQQGLVVILLRSGLDINHEKIRTAGSVALRLTFLPALFEALVTALASVVILNMMPLLALSQGFVLAAVSPAVVVGGMLNLRRQGYGVGKGIPSLVIAAASLDDIVAISAFSMCIGIAVRDESSKLVWLILNLPFTLILGLLVGIVGGLILSVTTLWTKRWQRTSLLLLFGLIAMNGTKKIGFPGSGALASIAMGAIASSVWQGLCHRCRQKNHCGSEDMVRQTGRDMDFIWTTISEPLLFASVGTALNFHIIPARTIPWGLAIIIMGILGRISVAYICCIGAGFTNREKWLVALSWCPKATVQAALCFVPQAMVEEVMVGRPEYKLYAEMSNHIITTSILSILVTAPIGIIIIERYGPKWLECDVSTTANTANPKNVNECNAPASIEILEKECINRDAGGNDSGHGSSP